MFKFIICSAVCVVLLTAEATANWRFLPAGEPQVQSVAADSTGQRLFINAGNAGTWRSSNGGAVWVPANQQFWPGASNWADVQTVDPGGSILLATVRARGPIYASERYFNQYSRDGGQSWFPFPLERIRDTGTVQVWRAHPNVWLHVKNYLFSKSADFGQTWTTPDTLPDYGTITLYQDPLEDSTLYFTVLASMGNVAARLWRSRDFGASWENILDLRPEYPSSGPRPRAFLRLSNGDLLLVLHSSRLPQNGIILISTDAGQTWSTGAIPDDYWHFATLVETGSHPGRLFLQGTSNLYRSNDFGRTWQIVSGDWPRWSVTSLYQNKFSGTLFVSTEADGVFTSTDGGDTWQRVTSPPIGSGNINVWEPCYFFQREAVFYRLNINDYQWQLEAPYSEWQPISGFPALPDTHVSIGSVLYKNADTLIAGARIISTGTYNEYSAMARSTDNGRTWELGPRLPFTFAYYPQISAYTNDSLCRFVAPQASATQADILWISGDMGLTWFPSLEPAEEARWYLQEIIQNDRGIFVSKGNNSGGILIQHSTDDGRSWRNLEGLPRRGIVPQLAVVDDMVFVVNSDDNRCWLWDGTGWQVRGLAPFDFSYMYFLSKLAVIAENPSLLMAVQRDSAAIWLSYDSAATWVTSAFELPYADQISRISNPSYDPYRHRVWLNTGVGACWLDAAELTVPGAPLQFKPADYTVLSAYPNPFNDQTRIRFDLLKAQRVELKLYDLHGRLVRTLADAQRDAGRHELTFDARGLASGTYFVRLQSAAAVRTQKILLLR